MKFSCSREDLQLALNIARHGIKEKTPMSILKGILFNVYNHKLHLTANDMNIGITTDIDVDAQEDGAVVLDADLIFSIVSRLSGDVVYFTSEENDYIKIESDFSKFTIAGLPADEYPKFPKPDTDINFKVESQVLKDLINKTSFAASAKDNQIPIITGLNMEYEADGIRLVGIDGFRVALKNGKLEEEVKERMTCVISARNLNELSALLSLIPTEDVNINLSKTQAFFQMDNTIFTSSLIEGNFFDYTSIIPKNTNTSFKIDKNELLKCCQRAIIVSSNQDNSLLRFDIESGKLRLSAKNETGNFNEALDIENIGDDLTIAFNNKFLIDALKSIDDEEIQLSFSGEVGPLNITPVEGDEYTYLVLPIRLNA